MKQFRFLACAAALALAACGDDPFSTGDTLTEEEAAAIMAAMAEGSFEDLTDEIQQASPGAPSQAAGASAAEITISASGSCEGGGTVSVTGTVNGDFETGDGTFEIDVTEIVNECLIVHEGIEFYVSSDPSITLDADFELENGEPVGEQSIKFNGGFVWESDDARDGGCRVEFTAIFNPTTQTGSFSGKVCDYEFDVTIS